MKNENNLAFHSIPCYTFAMVNYMSVKLETLVQIDSIYSLHYRTFAKSYSFIGEAHDFWEFIYCDSGEAIIMDNDNEFKLLSGNAFFHAPNHFHNVKPNNQFTNMLIFSFNGNLAEVETIQRKIFKLDKDEKAIIKTIIAEGFHKSYAFHEYVNNYMQNREQEIFLPPPPASITHLIKNCIESLIINIYKNMQTLSEPPCDSKTRNQAETIAAKVRQILEENTFSRLRLKDLAAKLNYSKAHLQNIFKQDTNTTIKQYYIRLKINKAKQMLSETSYTISQISEMLDFGSPQQFSQAFKKVTNMSPSAYLNSTSSGVLL